MRKYEIIDLFFLSLKLSKKGNNINCSITVEDSLDIQRSREFIQTVGLTNLTMC